MNKNRMSKIELVDLVEKSGRRKINDIANGNGTWSLCFECLKSKRVDIIDYVESNRVGQIYVLNQHGEIN